MSEFKGQILGIVLVLSIFIALNGTVRDFFSTTFANIQNQVSEALEN